MPTCLCGYDLRGSVIKDGGAHCPECGRRFSRRDVDNLRQSDPRGEPLGYPIGESRLQGRIVMFAVVTAVALAIVGILLVVIRVF